MLRAAELIDEQDALDAAQIATGAGFTGERWDAGGDVSQGDFFSQERAMIADQARIGNISSEQAAGLSRVLARLQGQSAGDAAGGWYAGQFRRRYPCSVLVPALARAALVTTAGGIPTEALGDASLLISELVTNSVTHSRSEWVDVEISLTADRRGIAVCDHDKQSIQPRTPDTDGGFGLTFVAQLATRWGVDKAIDSKTIWIELDLQQAPVLA